MKKQNQNQNQNVKVFCYGTLQSPSVQQELIGRTVTGQINRLSGYVVLCDYVDPSDGIAYPRLVSHPRGVVYGTILEFTPAELIKINEYETDMYELESVVTDSGESVLTYMPVVKEVNI